MKLPAFETFRRKIVSKDHCIRRTDQSVAPTCNLFEYHVLLIQKIKNFEPHIPSRSRKIATWIFIENPLYQKYRSAGDFAVAPLRVSYTPDTRSQFSSTYPFSFLRNVNLNIHSEKPVYQEYRSTAGFVVPPLWVSCTPGTIFEFSATYFSSFSKDSYLNIRRETSLWGVTLYGRLYRAIASSIMYS